METAYDIVDGLGSDLGLIIMALLDVLDVIRASAVSKTWRRFVIANGLCKKLFIRLFPLPQVARIAYEIEGTPQTIKFPDALAVGGGDWGALERDHKIYSALLQPLATPMYLPRNCLLYPIGASSTRDIEEHILNTMNPVDEFPGGHIRWSSEGQVDPRVPEYIAYKLRSNMCIVTEVNIRPYQAPLERGRPVYSPTSVRFRFGYSKSLNDSQIKFCPGDHTTFEMYNWTYTSPVFPMTQEAGMHQFKLPEPTVCVGGVVQIELMGRAQTDPDDGLFYIRLGYVKILGQSIHPAYTLDLLENEELQLKFNPHVIDRVLRPFRRDPRDMAQMARLWQVSNTEMITHRAIVQDRPQAEQDSRFIDELLAEALSSSSI